MFQSLAHNRRNPRKTQNFAVQADETALGDCTTTNRGQIVIAVIDGNIDVSTCIAAAETDPVVSNAFNQVIALN